MIIELHAVPNAKEFALNLREGKLFARIPAKPEGGKANRELLARLRKLFGKKVALMSGGKSRDKKIFVETENEIEEKEVRDKIFSRAGVAEPGQKR